MTEEINSHPIKNKYYKHIWYVLIFPAYLIAFFILEKLIPNDFPPDKMFLSHIPLDDMIPFRAYFALVSGACGCRNISHLPRRKGLHKIYDIHRRNVLYNDYHLRGFPELSGYAPRHNGKRKHILLYDEAHLHSRYIYKRPPQRARFRRNGDRFCGH